MTNSTEQFNSQQSTAEHVSLEAVMQSPRAVAAHDKAAWMAIFARYNIVEDPVGSKPHLSGVYDAVSGRRGFGPLSRFYDAFIAPNDIVFHVDCDVACGLSVVRDLTIEINMSSQVCVRVPMHLHYELVAEQEELKILRLAAHWELLPMIGQLMGQGLATVPVVMAMGGRMFKQLGLLGMINFVKAANNIGSTGKSAVENFSQHFNRQSEDALNCLFVGSDAGASTEFLISGQEQEVDLEALLTERTTLSLGKTLASGNFVTVSVSLSNAGNSYQGVAFFEFNTRSKAIDRVRFYLR